MQGCAKCNNIRNVIITCTLQGKIIGKRFREMTPANRGKLRREIRVPISNTARLSLCVYVGNSEKVICPRLSPQNIMHRHPMSFGQNVTVLEDTFCLVVQLGWPKFDLWACSVEIRQKRLNLSKGKGDGKMIKLFDINRHSRRRRERSEPCTNVFTIGEAAWSSNGFWDIKSFRGQRIQL